MTAEQVAADLRAAAEVLRRDGWVQGAMHRACGHCAVGAIEVALDPDDWGEDDGWTDEQNRRFADAARLLRSVVGRRALTGWNDEPGRTADEVIDALEAAAQAAERQAAYDEGRWCGECQYGVVMDPPCCAQGPVQP